MSSIDAPSTSTVVLGATDPTPPQEDRSEKVFRAASELGQLVARYVEQLPPDHVFNDEVRIRDSSVINLRHCLPAHMIAEETYPDTGKEGSLKASVLHLTRGGNLVLTSLINDWDTIFGPHDSLVPRVVPTSSQTAELVDAEEAERLMGIARPMLETKLQ